LLLCVTTRTVFQLARHPTDRGFLVLFFRKENLLLLPTR
jgi:hypothetical protein